MYGHLRAAFWFLCLILFLVAHPSFHLHWWWSNHEHALPQPTGSEKPRCLVSVDLISGRSWFPYVSVCSHASFMGRLNADSHLFLWLCFPQVGSQEQPRAMEQNGAQSTVQSMNSYPLFTQILFRFFFFYRILNKLGLKHISLTIHIFPVIMWQSPCCPVTLTVHVCVCF